MMSYTDMKIFNPEKIIKSWCILLRLSSCPPCSFFPSWSSRYHPHHHVHRHHVHRHHVHHKPFSRASFSSFPSLFGFFGGLWLAAGGLKINFDQSKKNINYKSSFGGKIKKNIYKDLMGLVGLEKLAWLEAADSSDSRRVGSYGSSPGSKGMLGRKHENNIKKRCLLRQGFC